MTQRIAASASVCIIALGFFGGSAAQAQTYYQTPPPYQAPPYYYSRDPDRREYGPRDYGPRDYSPPEYGAHGYDWGLPPYEIMRIVRSRGLAPLTRPMRRGSTYVVVAANRSGGQMRVVLDAASGDIMTVNPMLGAGPYGAPPPYQNAGPMPEEQSGRYAGDPRYEGGPPVPPRDVPRAPLSTNPMASDPMARPRGAPAPYGVVQSPRLATAPAMTPAPGASVPARTPLPRPRPKLAATDAAGARSPASEQAPPAPSQATIAAVPSATAPAIINPSPVQSPDGGTVMVPVAPLE